MCSLLPSNSASRNLGSRNSFTGVDNWKPPKCLVTCDRVNCGVSVTLPTLHPVMSSACLLSVENFSQRISLIRKVRNTETKENGQKRPNNNNVIIKHSQGSLALSQGL